MAGKKSTKDELVAEIRTLGQTQGLNTVFTTFLEISAVSIAAQMDPFQAEECETRYEKMVAGMTPETVTAYARMLALLWMVTREHKDDPCDILGSIYHELRLNNEWNGQFFTPDNICRTMAMMLNPVTEPETAKDYITIGEPACGSGTMVIGAVWAMIRSGFDYRNKALFYATDIDIRCVWMTYIQMFLYEIPAIVIHGNSLTEEEWSSWYTPQAVLLLGKEQSQEVAV